MSMVDAERTDAEGEQETAPQALDNTMHSIMNHLTGLMDDDLLSGSRNDSPVPFTSCRCCLASSGTHNCQPRSEETDVVDRGPITCSNTSCRSPLYDPSESDAASNSSIGRGPGCSGHSRRLHFLHQVSLDHLKTGMQIYHNVVGETGNEKDK